MHHVELQCCHKHHVVTMSIREFMLDLIGIIFLFCTENREKWLASEAGWACEVMASPLLRHER